MPNHISALKRVKQTKKRTAINRSNKGVFRASLRRVRQALATGDRDKTQQLLPQTLSSIDKAVQKGLIHRNTAGRLKSRLMARVNVLSPVTPKP